MTVQYIRVKLLAIRICFHNSVNTNQCVWAPVCQLEANNSFLLSILHLLLLRQKRSRLPLILLFGFIVSLQLDLLPTTRQMASHKILQKRKNPALSRLRFYELSINTKDI